MASQPINFSPLVNPMGEQCGICWDTSDDLPKIYHEAETSQTDKKVKHIFCKNCLTTAMKVPTSPRKCPLCMKPINVGSIFDHAEMDTFIAEENRRGKEWEKEINKGIPIRLMSIQLTALHGSALDILQNYYGINIAGFLTTSVISWIAAVSTSKLYQNRDEDFHTLIITNATFCSFLLSSLTLLDPLSLRSFFTPTNILDQASIFTPSNILDVTSMVAVPLAVYTTATWLISHYYLPGRVEFIPSNGQGEVPRVKFTMTNNVTHAIAFGLFTRTLWGYFQG